MRAKGMDYFENSRRATYVQQQYAIQNPLKFKGCGEFCRGITASEGPGPATIKVNGREREFFGYLAREVPNGPDDGAIAPWAVVASLPFAPEIVLPTLDHFVYHCKLKDEDHCGFKATFNETHPDRSTNPFGWVSPWQFGLNQGPIVLMVENYRSDLLWRLMRNCPYLVSGLPRTGFTGGWLLDSRWENCGSSRDTLTAERANPQLAGQRWSQPFNSSKPWAAAGMKNRSWREAPG